MNHKEIEKSMAVAAMILLRYQHEDKRSSDGQEVVWLRNRINRITTEIEKVDLLPDVLKYEAVILRKSFAQLYDDGGLVKGENDETEAPTNEAEPILAEPTEGTRAALRNILAVLDDSVIGRRAIVMGRRLIEWLLDHNAARNHVGHEITWIDEALVGQMADGIVNEHVRRISGVLGAERESAVFSDNGPTNTPSYRLVWEHGRDHLLSVLRRALHHHYPSAFTEEEHAACGSAYSADPTNANYMPMREAQEAPTEVPPTPQPKYHAPTSLVDKPDYDREFFVEPVVEADPPPSAALLADEIDNCKLLQVSVSLLMAMKTSSVGSYCALVLDRGWNGIAVIGTVTDIDLVPDEWLDCASLVAYDDGRILKNRYPSEFGAPAANKN